MVKNAELLSAIKAAGEAAIRLHEDNERLRGLLRDGTRDGMTVAERANWKITVRAALGAADQPGAAQKETWPLDRDECARLGAADNSSATAPAAAAPAPGSTAEGREV